MSRIGLFQNDRNWKTISNQVFDLVNQSHSTGMAQNSQLVQKLEERLAKKYNRKYCVTVASCTDALVIALELLNLPIGSAVAVSNYTFTATAHAVARAGYRVIPIDITDRYCINTELIGTVDAVVNVDLFGNMANWGKLSQLDFPVINDAAQSLESYNGDHWSAELGEISCISFSPSKTISSWGSGGAILTNNSVYADTARKLRLHGKLNNESPSIHPGMNSMISTFEAACIHTGLDYSDQWQQRRTKISRYLADESRYPCGIDFTLPKHTLHKLVFQTNDIDRDKLLEKFYHAEIDCSVHYKLTVNDEPLYKTENKYPVSDCLKTQSFTVPNQHTLTDLEVEKIAKVLR
jgi:UDP-2-acetamido-2-deoxy-ribo-hexuluronate aminotransferase